MKKYFLISLVLICAQGGWAKKTRVISSESGISTTYHFVLPTNTANAKDFKLTVSKMGDAYVGQLKVKLNSGEHKDLQLSCFLLAKLKTLRCVRDDGGGRFEITALVNAKGEKTYKLKIRHLDLGSEQEEPLAISGPNSNEALEADGKVEAP